MTCAACIYYNVEKRGGALSMQNNKTSSADNLPLRDYVFNKLRSAILRDQLPAGTRLVELELSKELGVSRTPVREAIRMLQDEGLVSITPRKGAQVSRITSKDMQEVLEIRASLENLAIELACSRISQEELNELKWACDAFRHAVNTEADISEIAEKDVAFHDMILRATHNNRLILLLDNFHEQMYRYRLEHIKDISSRQEIVREHEEILDAITRHDKETAIRLMSSHIEHQAVIVLRLIHQNSF